MTQAVADAFYALVMEAGGRLCALPAAHVVETMRPRPLDAMPGAPPFVLGLALIRGAPVPVVDLRALLGEAAPAPPTRFVTIQVDDRRVALAVEAVLGLQALTRARLEALPPLLREVGLLEAIAAADARFLLVLQAGRLLPTETAGPSEAPGPGESRP